MDEAIDIDSLTSEAYEQGYADGESDGYDAGYADAEAEWDRQEAPTGE